MAELIFGKNKDKFIDKNSCNYNIDKKSQKIEEDINRQFRSDSYNSENNLFNINNDLDEVENFEDINEMSLSEKTDNNSNLSDEIKENLMISKNQNEEISDSNLNLKAKRDNEDGLNTETKPRFAISHKLSK